MPAGAHLLHALGGVDDFLRVVSTCAGQHRHFPGGFLDDELHDADAFVFRQRRTLARRPARHEKVDTGLDLSPRETPDAGLVDCTLARERRHQCRSASRPWRSHHALLNSRGLLRSQGLPQIPGLLKLPTVTSRHDVLGTARGRSVHRMGHRAKPCVEIIVRSRSDYNPKTSRIENHPRRPLTHLAASSAPLANPVRSRAVCVSVIVSAGLSNPTVCVPGIEPTRVDATSIGSAVPGLLHRFADRDGRAGRCVSLGPVVELVDPGAKLRPVGEQFGRTRGERHEQVHAQREVRRRDDADRIRRHLAPEGFFLVLPAGRADHEVRPARGELPGVARNGRADRKVDRHVGGRPVLWPVGIVDVDPAGNVDARLRRQRLDEPAHAAVANDAAPAPRSPRRPRRETRSPGPRTRHCAGATSRSAGRCRE